jgi:hypothetical protein
LKLIRYAGAESRNGTFSLAGRAEGILELVVSRHVARLTGSIKRSGNSGRTITATPQVVLIPDTMDSIERESETHQAIFDQNGNFSISRIRPGAYALYAFETVPEGCWTDPEFIREIAGKGIDVQVGEGEAKSIEVPLLLRSEIADILNRLGIE